MVTAILILANLLAYVAGVDAYRYALVPAHLNVESALTSMFLHASVAHIAGNMLFLAVFGTIVEHELGSLRFAALYLAAGIVGALTHAAVSATPLVGASGAIFGVLAVSAALRPRLLGFVVVFVGFNVWHAFVGGDDGVSFGAHIGGFAVGAMVAMIMRCSGSLRTA